MGPNTEWIIINLAPEQIEALMIVAAFVLVFWFLFLSFIWYFMQGRMEEGEWPKEKRDD